jgi:hypothetical protein
MRVGIRHRKKRAKPAHVKVLAFIDYSGARFANDIAKHVNNSGLRYIDHGDRVLRRQRVRHHARWWQRRAGSTRLLLEVDGHPDDSEGADGRIFEVIPGGVIV